MDQLQLFKNIPCHYTYWSTSPVQVTLPQPMLLYTSSALYGLVPEAVHAVYTLYLHILHDS